MAFIGMVEIIVHVLTLKTTKNQANQKWWADQNVWLSPKVYELQFCTVGS